ncbi:unnamed protein product, partial [Cylindrotheca closterium]
MLPFILGLVGGRACTANWKLEIEKVLMQNIAVDALCG